MPLFCHRITELIYKYQREELSEEERTELHQYIDQSEEREQMFNNLNDLDWVSGELNRMSQIDVQAKWENFVQLHPFEKEKRDWRKLAVAACIGLLAAVAWYLLVPTQPTQPPVINIPAVVKDSFPDKLTRLTLNDGTTIVIDSVPDGVIATEGRVEIIKQDTLLKYQLIGIDSLRQLSDHYHVFSTPRSGKYQLQLADNSHISLNAESSIRFPVAFPGSRRQVEITGEALFDVVNDGRPFNVLVSGAKDSMLHAKRNYKINIEVLGTSFNVNAYKDEDVVRTTLLSGSIKIAAAGPAKILKPGQQAAIDKKGQIQVLTLSDRQSLKNIIAWKNGEFAFEEDIKTIMKQLARWYDLTVVYEGDVSSGKTILECSKSLPFEKVLAILEKSGFRFKIEGRHVTVL